MSGPTIEAVLAIARQVPIFPCRVREEWIEKDGPRVRRGPKSPYTETGFKAASQDPDQLRQWHQRYPGCLWGVPTGSLTKLIAIDYDPGKATQETQDWIAEHSKPIEQTPERRAEISERLKAARAKITGAE